MGGYSMHMFKRLMAVLLTLAMLLSLAACGAPAKQTAQDQGLSGAQQDVSSTVDMTREDKELIAELIGGEENASDLSDDELDALIDQIILSTGKETTSNIIHLANGNQSQQVVSNVTEDLDREDKELVAELIGGKENTSDLTDEELDDIVDQIVDNLDDTANQDPEIDVDPDAYDEEGAMKDPFDQVYPELIEEELVSFSGESILVKLASGNLTSGLKAAGVGSLELIVPLSGCAWYEAKLVEGTDVKEALAAVRKLDEVLLAEYNYEIKTDSIDEYQSFDEEKEELFSKNSNYSDQWYLHHCGIVGGYEEMTTAGGDSSVIVAVIDTGVDYDHEDLIDNMWVNIREIPDNGIDDDSNGYVDDYYGVDIVAKRGNGDDTNGHGTHVAGIIAARNNNVGVLGIAYNVKIMSVKAAMHNGTLNQADIAKAVLYAYENGAEVINMSFGGTACSIAVQDALATAYTRCVLVASAGNNGKHNEILIGALPNYPAALTYVLGVMSVDSTGRESAFTNWDVEAFSGVEYELYAPGENIMSTLPGNKYGYLSGTSMAAPVVSAFAAILRSEFADRDKYPTKFIYGQLAATSGVRADCLDPELHGPHNLPLVANLYTALTVMPEPDVHLQEYRVFDDPKYSSKNNGDGVIDAGETFALGLVLRNRWGMSENTLVTVDTISETSGMSDPYITIHNPTVNYDSVGTYSTQDCGKIMEDGLFVGWESPFLITVSEDCPNDYRFTLNVTINCENALDEEDTAIYTSTSAVDENVRAGVILPQIIEEDMILTKENLYIIPHATIIQAGVTVRVEPGTHLQFWSDDPNDSYAENYVAYLRVDGTLLVEGTPEEPVYIYPSQLMDAYNVELTEGGASGYISLKYADITNLAACNAVSGYYNEISLAENCTFRINYGTGMNYRYISGSSVYSSSTSSYRIANFDLVRDSVFYKIGCIYGAPMFLGNAENCIFAECGLQYGYSGNAEFFSAVNCVFLGNYFQDQTAPDTYSNSYWSYADKYSANNFSVSSLNVYYRPETGTTYVSCPHDKSLEKILELYMGVGFAVCETEEEFDWITANVKRSNYSSDDLFFGMVYNTDLQEYTWADGSPIPDFVDPDQIRKGYKGSYLLIVEYDSSAKDWALQISTYTYSSNCYAVYEIPGQILPETISLTDYEVRMDMASTYQIAPISAPVPLPSDGFLYESTDENILTVSENGLVTPLALGTADVKIYSLDKAVCNYVTINIVEYVPLEGIAFTQESGEVAIGEVLKASTVLTPANTSRRTVIYTSSDPGVATVDIYSGVVTGISSGTATITATCEEFSAQMTVTVYKKSTAISLNDYLYENLADGTVELPQVATDGEPILVWESTDTSVAQIVDGKLELRKPGTTNLIVTDVRSGLQDTAIVYVFENGLPAVKDVYGDYQHTYVLTEDGRVFLWGEYTPYSTPTRILSDKTIVWCSSCVNYNSYCYVYAIDTDGIAYCWSDGQIIRTNEFFKGMEIAGMASPGTSWFLVWTTDGTVYTWNSFADIPTVLDLPFKVAQVKVSDYNGKVFFLAEDGTLYSSKNGDGSDLVLINRNITAFELTYADWYVSNNVLYYDGQPTEITFSDDTKVALAHIESWTGCSLVIRDGSLSLYKHYARIYDYQNPQIDYQIHTEYPIDLGEPVKQIFYDGRSFAVTESNVVYRITLDNSYKTIDLEAIVLEQFENDPLQVIDINLTEVTEDDVPYYVLSEDVLKLTFNKLPFDTTGIVLQEDGISMPHKAKLQNNILTISGNLDFVPGHTYTLTLSAASFYAQSGANLPSDYTISFIYEENAPDTQPEVTEPEESLPEESVPEETQPEQEKEPVIHESVLDESIQRIYTAESLYAQIMEIHEVRQINPSFYGNVILNHVSTDDNVNHWFRPQAPSSTTYKELPLGGNYWGTVNERAIELQMVDYTDYPTYARLMYKPYITEIPENTFPFITSVKLFNKYGEEITVAGNEEVTFQVKFNRDMDTSIPLLVRFGSAYPYGDYEFEGAYVDERTWEGTYTLNTLIENGYQYFTISNGCSATDDLQLMTDRRRFGFEIDTTAAQALIMQGTATDTGIELSWTQDDFQTLMGYNVYRSDKEDGLYTRLNDVVIPADTMTFFDDTVEPGKIYYYNFTVVQTDLNESIPSGKIVIMSKDTMAPNIYHSPVANAFTGSNLVLSATITDNLSIAYANLYYRISGTDVWSTIRMNKLNDKYSAIVPAQYLTIAGLEYYIEAFDGVSYTRKGTADEPYAIVVQEAVSADALGDVDGDGVITNLDALLVLYTINDKYNMTAEEFARADLNGDGELWAAEALRILQYVSGVVGSVKM